MDIRIACFSSKIIATNTRLILRILQVLHELFKAEPHSKIRLWLHFFLYLHILKILAKHFNQNQQTKRFY